MRRNRLRSVRKKGFQVARESLWFKDGTRVRSVRAEVHPWLSRGWMAASPGSKSTIMLRPPAVMVSTDASERSVLGASSRSEESSSRCPLIRRRRASNAFSWKGFHAIAKYVPGSRSSGVRTNPALRGPGDGGGGRSGQGRAAAGPKEQGVNRRRTRARERAQPGGSGAGGHGCRLLWPGRGASRSRAVTGSWRSGVGFVPTWKRICEVGGSPTSIQGRKGGVRALLETRVGDLCHPKMSFISCPSP